MPRITALLLAAFGFAAVTVAAQTGGGVSESTDPGRAAAVERAASGVKARAAVAGGSAAAAAGPVRGRTADGAAFVAGGVSAEDRSAMHAERGAYSLWVATVARPSGAYLADVQLRIVEPKSRRVVLERKLEGPWLLAALPPGPYDVTGRFRAAGASADETITVRVNIAKGTQRQAVLRFASSAQVSPDAEPSFGGNPFGPPAKGR